MNNSEVLINSLKEKYGSDKTEKMLAYLDMVLDRNQYINLTAVRDRDEAIRKHILDSLTVTDIPEYVNSKDVVDIGTGAGFPGVFLAIADPDKKFTLIDSTLKRLKVIDEFTENLDINNVVTVHGRAEELSRKDPYKAGFDLCVSRAVADLQKLSGWCLPFVKKDSFFISYKGESYKSEIEKASAALKKYRGKIERVEMIKGDADDISGHVLIVIKKY